MPTDTEPIEGNWYEAIEDGARFFVVTVDEEEGIVELQHDDGAPGCCQTESPEDDVWGEPLAELDE